MNLGGPEALDRAQKYNRYKYTALVMSTADYEQFSEEREVQLRDMSGIESSIPMTEPSSDGGGQGGPADQLADSQIGHYQLS